MQESNDKIFNHLKIHSQYSICEGAVKIEDLKSYCKDNNLQNLDDKRIILPDKSLQKLLRIKKSDQLTYFNLQKYMKVHFPNKDGVYPAA